MPVGNYGFEREARLRDKPYLEGRDNPGLTGRDNSGSPTETLQSLLARCTLNSTGSPVNKTRG
jgi:hypothetical protein